MRLSLRAFLLNTSGRDALSAGRMSVESWFSLGVNLRLVSWLGDTLEAFSVAEKRSSREIADLVHRIPAGLNAANVGYNFINVVGNGHNRSSVQERHLKIERMSQAD
jgi:hypothetical protein